MGQLFSNDVVRKLGIFLLGFILYGYSISFDYTQDDAIVITDNMFTQQGVSGISGILSYDTFYGFFKEEGKDQLVQGGRYRPATLITFAFENSIFGNNPHISHAINAILYGLLCMLIFLFFRQCITETKLSEKAAEISLVIALLFAAHPIHTEVVANIKSRDEIFVALFGLLSTWIIMKKESKLFMLILAYLSLLIAFFSKENAIVYIVLIPITIWFFGNRDIKLKQWIFRLLPVVLMGGIYLFVRSNVISGGISEASMELMNNPFLKYNGTTMVPFSPNEKWATIIYNLGKYLQLLVFPFPLTSDYYPYHISIKTFANPLVLLSLLVHMGLIVSSIWAFIKRSPWAYGIIFYFGFLFLVSNVPFNIGTNISERFLFVPSIGFIFTICYLIYRFFGERSESLTKLKYPLILIILLFSVYSIYRSHVWKDDYTLLTTDVKISRNSAKALHGAAGALSTKSREIKDVNEQESMLNLSNKYLEEALTIYPFYNNAYLIQGNNYFYLKDYEKALESYDKLLKMDPDNTKALENMAVVLRDAGRYYGEKENNLQKSVDFLLRSYAINSKDYETARLLGVSHGMAGDHEKAVRFFTEATNILPDNAAAWYNLSKAYQYKGVEAAAISAMEKAKKLDPDILNKMK